MFASLLGERLPKVSSLTEDEIHTTFINKMKTLYEKIMVEICEWVGWFGSQLHNDLE